MRKGYFKLALNIPSIVWLLLRRFSEAWAEERILPVLENISSWVGVPVVALESFLMGVLLISSIWWLKSGLNRKTKMDESGKEVTSLEDIKNDLVAMSTREKELAISKAKQLCPKETMMQINNDFNAIFEVKAGTDNHLDIDKIKKEAVAIPILQRVMRNRDIDALVEYFGQFGHILDSNGYGLKVGLENDELYKASLMDLAIKRLRLKMRKKKEDITQKNIDRVRSLTYGLNSSILLRGILGSVPEIKGIVPAQIKVVLESIEATTEVALNQMLNNLENEWKVTPKWNVNTANQRM